MKTSKEEIDKHVNAQQWAEVFKLIGRGDFQSECGETFKGMNEALSSIAAQNGKAKGQITIVLNVKHEANGVVEIQPDLKVKMPATVRGKSIFWATESGRLAANDPRQQSLPLREVAAPDAPPKDAGPKAQQAKSV